MSSTNISHWFAAFVSLIEECYIGPHFLQRHIKTCPCRVGKNPPDGDIRAWDNQRGSNKKGSGTGISWHLKGLC